LNKALYGIKQAPKAWNDNINTFFISLGFSRCTKDTCVYYRCSKTRHPIIITIFVDDMLAAYYDEDKQEWNGYLLTLKQTYEVSDLGRVHHILGMRINYNVNKNLIIDQELYVKDKLKAFNMSECKHFSTPETAVKLINATENELLAPDNNYRSITGSLIYLAISTRPDITHGVNMLSRHMSKPGITHLNAAKRVLRYLQGTKSYGLHYQNNFTQREVNLTGYCDSDWAGDVEDRKSTTGYCVFINNNIVSWNTKKQQTIALSTAEAELMALVEVIKEVKWMKELLIELHFDVVSPIEIFVDNQSAIKMAQNDVEHDRTKHIDIKYHFIKRETEEKQIKLTWISSNLQLADVFTKALSSNLFQQHRDSILYNTANNM
jgi:hypothetical protein